MKFMNLQIVTPPTSTPVSIEEAKIHLRYENDEEDSLVVNLINAATELTEEILRRKLITQTWKIFLDSFPKYNQQWGDAIILPFPPAQSVTHVKYYDTNGNLTTLSASTDYVVDTSATPAEIHPAPQVNWPSVQTDKHNAVEVQFVCGYGASAAVPACIKSAILLILGHLFENRQAVSPVVMHELPMAINYLLAPYRDFRFI